MANDILALYLSALVAALDAVSPPLSPEPLTALQTSDPFFWVYQNQNNAFNAYTFNTITSRVAATATARAAVMQEAQTFTNGYVQLLTAMAYTLGSAELAALTDAQQRCADLAAAALDAYQADFPPITPEDLAASGFGTPVDYLVGHVVAAAWSGATPPLTVTAMAQAADLRTLLPDAPAKAGPTIAAVQTYLASMRPVAAIMAQSFGNTWALATARDNMTAPSAANGGMRLVSPVNGVVAADYQVRYGIGMPIGAIRDALADPGRVLRVSFDLPRPLAAVEMRKPAATFVPAQGGGRFVTPTAAVQSVTLTFTGYALVPVIPQTFDAATGTGWYSPAAVADAQANRGKPDAGGYHFQTDPLPCDPAPNGPCGSVASLLIANPPVVDIVYDRPQNPPRAIGALHLFGTMRPGGGRAIYQARPATAELAGPIPIDLELGNRIRFVPVAASVPWMMQSADILAGVVLWPGAPAR